MNHVAQRSLSVTTGFGALAVALTLLASGCGGAKDVGTVDISAMKKSAEEKGIAGPGERTQVRGGRTAAQ